MQTPALVKRELEDLARDTDMVVYRLERIDGVEPAGSELARVRTEIERIRDRLEALAHSLR